MEVLHTNVKFYIQIKYKRLFDCYTGNHSSFHSRKGLVSYVYPEEGGHN